MTIKEKLLALGMKEEELDSHYSDLYVLKNEISSKFVKDYEFKQSVTTFVSNIDGKVWYEIPFVASNEVSTRNISKQHYEGWNTFTDQKLQTQYLYITRWARDESLKFTIDKLMNDRGLQTFDNEVIHAEFAKAMQTRYTKDSELLDRVFEALYGNK